MYLWLFALEIIAFVSRPNRSAEVWFHFITHLYSSFLLCCNCKHWTLDIVKLEYHTQLSLFITFFFTVLAPHFVSTYAKPQNPFLICRIWFQCHICNTMYLTRTQNISFINCWAMVFQTKGWLMIYWFISFKLPFFCFVFHVATYNVRLKLISQINMHVKHTNTTMCDRKKIKIPNDYILNASRCSEITISADPEIEEERKR